MKKLYSLILPALLLAPTTGDAAGAGGEIIDPALGNASTNLLDGQPGEVADEAARAVALDPTEGNRGQSRNTNNNGDPFTTITGDAGEQVTQEGAPTNVIPNSTNAVSDLARERLLPATEVVINLHMEVRADYDVPTVFQRLLGTNNVKQGPNNTAIRSNVYSWKEDSGQRAIIVMKDGNVHLLPYGIDYASCYARAQEEGVAFFAIAYFKQNLSADNPFVSIRWYTKPEMQVPSKVAIQF